jgi:hypothetical protein
MKEVLAKARVVVAPLSASFYPLSMLLFLVDDVT